MTFAQAAPAVNFQTNQYLILRHLSPLTAPSQWLKDFYSTEAIDSPSASLWELGPCGGQWQPLVIPTHHASLSERAPPRVNVSVAEGEYLCQEATA